ncbi:hypothetical protein, partial [Ensifer adhaerens]|uniref:hypothetical protein n=1 Tax=Ensifer adhaerens TaxID=106592 RepID=UPI001AEC73D4
KTASSTLSSSISMNPRYHARRSKSCGSARMDTINLKSLQLKKRWGVDVAYFALTGKRSFLRPPLHMDGRNITRNMFSRTYCGLQSS